MFFNKRIFNKGMNITIRKGSKWFKAQIGDTLIIKLSGTDKVITTTKVEAIAHIQYRTIPAYWLKFEQDPERQTHKGLLKALKEHYYDIKADDFVTVIFFEI